MFARRQSGASIGESGASESGPSTARSSANLVEILIAVTLVVILVAVVTFVARATRHASDHEAWRGRPAGAAGYAPVCPVSDARLAMASGPTENAAPARAHGARVSRIVRTTSSGSACRPVRFLE